MVRISKDPELRRRELIDIAERLFTKKGYDEITISDIVKAAGVAQGTFYYYFKTKDDILDAIADDYLSETARLADEVAARQDLNAIEKILSISAWSRGLTKDKKRIVVPLHEDRHAHLHLKLEKKSMRVLLEPLRAIVRQGIQEGHFHMDYPEEAVLSLIAVVSAIMDTPEEVAELAETWQTSEGKAESEHMKRNIGAILDITERILGARKGIFKMHAKKMKGLDTGA